MEPRAIEKIAEVDKHVGLASSGLTADSKTLIDRARLECQNHWFTYNESMGVESVAQGVSNLAIKFGDDGDGGEDSAGAMVSALAQCFYMGMVWYGTGHSVEMANLCIP
jgi:20S proteasome subunit alpha 5